MISDAFDMSLTGDVVYEVDCKMITVKKGADVGSLHASFSFYHFSGRKLTKMQILVPMPQPRRPPRHLRMGKKLLTTLPTPSASPRQVLIGTPILPTLEVMLAFTLAFEKSS